MRMLAGAVLSMAMLISLAVPAGAARVGEVVNYALHTDIIAQIDGHPVRSYNVDGRTAVVAEDLRGYGFYALWNPEARRLDVVRAPGTDGRPVTPERWPEYRAAALTSPVGSRAQAIYATDIVAAVAGQMVQSFNIGGETVIWLSDLAAYGQVQWDEERRIANLALGDPLDIAVEALTGQLEAWKEWSPLSYCECTYHNPSGREDGPRSALVLTSYSGTPHGTSKQMVYIDPLGRRLSINALLPVYGYGTDYYLNPRDICLEGERLSFITPVKETLSWQDGSWQDWGECLCVVDLHSGKLLTMQPVNQPAEQWSAAVGSWKDENFSQTLQVEAVMNQGRVEITEKTFPGNGIRVSMDARQVSISHQAAMLLHEHYLSSTYYRAWQALQSMELPRISQENFSPENSGELRAKAEVYFKVTLNGQPLSGNLWWSQGNNHVDLNFEFDKPVHLSQGDALALWVGLPGQE